METEPLAQKKRAMVMGHEAISTEYIEAREDELAQLIIASEGMDKLRRVATVLHRRQMITTPYYVDMRDTIDQATSALLIGRRNTAALRNARRNS